MSPHAEGLQELNGTNVTSHGPRNFVNGNTTKHASSSSATESHLRRGHDDDDFDLICVGFGPANLALAIAIHDALDSHYPLPGLARLHRHPPKLLFLERQEQFGWHRGMLLPGAKMQISFVKDLATFRNPRSEFTFLNYLYKHNRLASFTNLDTFLPQRIEYEDYMKWCAAAFDHVVDYGQEVVQIIPETETEFKQSMTINSFGVLVKDIHTQAVRTLRSKKVIMAIGGKPQIPAPFPPHHPRVFHSSTYATNVDGVLPDKFAPYTVAVVGCGQSAAEIFNDLQTKFPNARTRLIIRGASLRPSDDSPFVNEIFDPDQIDSFYGRTAEQQRASIAQDRGTNYGVVRIGLLEHIYETLYMQRLKNPDHRDWQHRVLSNQTVVDVQASEHAIRLHLQESLQCSKGQPKFQESMDVDALIVATGYTRDMHEDILKPVRDLRSLNARKGKEWPVTRDYKVELDSSRVARDAGLWLSGCNEETHGLSDTLLSVLSTRGGELTQSILGD